MTDAAPALDVRAPVVRISGRAGYVPTWNAMREFTARRGPDTPDELWIVEHDPVFTLGQAGRREHVLDAGDIPVIATDRGGQVTYHGPGQVVVYALLDLKRLGIFVKELVYRIETSVIQVLDSYGADGRRVKGAPGVYVPFESTSRDEFAGLAKIAAIGIKITRGCSYHGVAFNVAMDLAPFSHIDPCGYAGLSTVDLRRIGISTTWADAAERLSERLACHFSR
ncbi:MAG: lipoyl(octanoyl) transferase LipB [Gemmatimonadota bacterium]